MTSLSSFSVWALVAMEMTSLDVLLFRGVARILEREGQNIKRLRTKCAKNFGPEAMPTN